MGFFSLSIFFSLSTSFFQLSFLFSLFHAAVDAPRCLRPVETVEAGGGTEAESPLMIGEGEGEGTEEAVAAAAAAAFAAAAASAASASSLAASALSCASIILPSPPTALSHATITTP